MKNGRSITENGLNGKDHNGDAPVFVTGATGYVGLAVVRQLIERKVPVVAHVRPDSPRLGHWRKTFDEMGAVVDTTAWDEQAMASTLDKVRPRALFCLIGTTAKRVGQAKKMGKEKGHVNYDAVDYGLTALLVQAAQNACATPKFVYLSSIGTSPKASGAYLKARWKAEEAVRNSGLPYIIARPSFISGPDRSEFRLGERVATITGDFLLSSLSLIGGKKLKAKYGSLDAACLARALIVLTMDATRVNEVVEADGLRKL